MGTGGRPQRKSSRDEEPTDSRLRRAFAAAFPERVELLCVTDEAGVLRIEEYGASAPEFFGTAEEALAGAPLLGYFDPDPAVVADVDRVAEGAQPGLETVAHLKQPGTGRQAVWLSLRTTEDDAGRRVVAALVETRTLAAPAELSADIANVGTILNAANIALTVVDPDYRICGFNEKSARNAREVLGHDLRDGISIIDIAVPESIPVLKEHLARAFAGETVSYQWTHTPGTGPRRSFVFTYVPVVSPSGTVSAVALATLDITAVHALQEHDRELAVAVEQSPVAIVITDAEGAIQYVNPFFERQTGYAREEVIGRNPRMFASGQVSVETYEALWSTILSGRRWSGELVNRRKDGTLYREQAVIAPVVEDAGVPVRFVAIKQDITERHRALEELRRSEERFRTLFDRSVDALYVHDLSGRILDVNQSAASMTGWAVDELVGMNIGELDDVFGHDPPPELDVDPEPQTGPDATAPLVVETVHRCKDGTRIPVEVRLGRLQLGADDVILAVVRDLSEVKQARSALAESEERYRMLFETSPVGILFCAADGSVVDGNPAFQSIFRTPELLSEADANVFSSPLLTEAGIAGAVQEVLDTDAPVYGEQECSLGSGSTGVLRYIVTPTHDSAGRVSGAQTLIEDFTVRRDAERRLSESLAEKDTLLREIHHRVKNNLQTISSLLRLQSDRVSEPRAHEALLDSVARVQSMAMVHEKLYNTEHLNRVRFDEYLDELVRHLLLVSADTGVTPDLELGLEPAELSIAVAVPLGLLANELISNTFKHAFGTAEEPRLSVRLAVTPGGLRLTVSDNGPGFTPEGGEDQPESLGMQLVSALVRQLSARIAFASEGGTTVSVLVPLAGADAGG